MLSLLLQNKLRVSICNEKNGVMRLTLKDIFQGIQGHNRPPKHPTNGAVSFITKLL